MTRRYEIVENAREKDFIYEDTLPEDLSSEDYTAWFKLSSVPGYTGCRVGPPVRRLETIQDEKLSLEEVKTWILKNTRCTYTIGETRGGFKYLIVTEGGQDEDN